MIKKIQGLNSNRNKSRKYSKKPITFCQNTDILHQFSFKLPHCQSLLLPIYFSYKITIHIEKQVDYSDAYFWAYHPNYIRLISYWDHLMVGKEEISQKMSKFKYAQKNIALLLKDRHNFSLPHGSNYTALDGTSGKGSCKNLSVIVSVTNLAKFSLT